MKFNIAAVSVLALGLFMGPVMAQETQEQPSQEQPAAEQPAAEQPATEQPAAEQPAAEQPAAEQPAQDAAPPAVPEAVLALLNDRRSAQELGDDELKARVKQARQLYKTRGLPDDIKGQLQAMVDADRAELETRAQAQKPSEEPAAKQAEEVAPQPEPKQEEPAAKQVEEAEPAPKQEEPVQQAQPESAPEPAKIPAEVTDVLTDTRMLEELTDKQLAARARFARQQSGNNALPEDVRQQLAAIGKAARAALAARQQQADEKKTEEPATPPAQQQTEQPAPKQEEQAQQPQPETAPVVEPPVEAKAAEPTAPTQPAPVDKAEAKELDGNAGDPEAEKKAKVFLDDPTPADSLSDEALRTRLDGIRDLMAENELSSKTERALREKLRNERVVLRERVAKVKAEDEAKAAAAKAEEEKKKQQAAADAGQQPPPKKDKKPNINIIITADTPIREILRDRREAEQMDESELRYRIRARREFEASQQFRDFDEEQRIDWRDRNRRDREYLGRRLQEDRNIRRAELEKPSNIRRIVIEDDQSFADEDIPEDVFAAEVDDNEIERALLAPPRKKVTRKISVNEIATQPKARAAMTRIEVDTIRFGFNEAFVREEEVDSLDQIASVMERVLKKYPREVFLIEGHTDAVGSDAYNDKLSKARAEAVKKALTTYYIIPSKNLETVGLGERYLKIPTAEQEQENRRVSISRATAVVGEADE